jgi:vesicle coat complex subunit
MESIIQHLQSNEVLVKSKALEDLHQKLQKKTNLNSLQVDIKLRLINYTVNALKDANPKIVLCAMDCVQIFIEQYSIDFQSLVNMTFDILLTKFGDSKVSMSY